MTHALTIGESTIRQQDGLYSLNDLHKASGGADIHRPAQFLRSDQTKALITEICNFADLYNYLRTIRGANGGTYACRELVIAYAAWISPAFHLKVIRVFMSAVQPVQQHIPNPAEAPTLKNRRWLISFDFDGKERVIPVPMDASVLTVPEFIKELRTNDYMTFPLSIIPEIMRSCIERMAAQIPRVVKS